jgi:glycosyltransferase involved in cell wall biosynthesis
MKPLVISSSDVYGGAARCAYRLHQGFKRIDVDSQMLVQIKQSEDKAVIGGSSESGITKCSTGLQLTLDLMPLKLYPNRTGSLLSPQWVPSNINSQIAQINPDIINLHWINGAYLQIEEIKKLKKPVVWTLHDMWTFTGGCHYDQDCNRYTESCGACPQLNSNNGLDLSRWIWSRKSKAWKNLNLTIVTPSVWLSECAKTSSLLRDKYVEVIPTGLDTKIYRPFDKQVARRLLGLPEDKQLILFGSVKATSDKRKGFHLLQPALNELSTSGWRDKLELVIFGAAQKDKDNEFGLKAHYLGTLNDDLSLALAYSAADAFVAPSVQDNLPNTVMEALSCGTPCIGFNIGGMPDMIEHQKNGYLAQPFKIEDLAKGISWVLENQSRWQNLSQHARSKIEAEFTLEIQASRYSQLFNRILASS